MTFMRTSLLAALFALSTGLTAHAALGPADFGAGVFVGNPSCKAQQDAHTLCCSGQAQCSQYLATTRINRARHLMHT